MILDGEEYENTAWSICLFLEGKRRIENNAERTIRRYIDNVPDEIVENMAISEDPFSEIEWMDLLERVMKELSPEQEMILRWLKKQISLAMWV